MTHLEPWGSADCSGQSKHQRQHLRPGQFMVRQSRLRLRYREERRGGAYPGAGSRKPSVDSSVKGYEFAFGDPGLRSRRRAAETWT